MIYRTFYQLPDPQEGGLKWRAFERGKQKLNRVEGRLREAQKRRGEVEEQIKNLGDKEVTELAQAILAGEADPAARHAEHEALVAELRVLKREEEALAQALPQAEEELRQEIFDHQREWIPQADKALERAITEERRSYAKAVELIEGPRAKRLFLEALAKWIRYPQSTFSGGGGDVTARSVIQNLGGDALLAEERMAERRHAELLQLQQQQEEGVA